MGSWGNVVMVGDMNVALTRLDVGGGLVFRSDRGREALGDLMRQHGLTDVWRDRNGGVRGFSRRQIVQGVLKQSRLDLALCTGDVAWRVRDVFYKSVGFSDHDLLVVDFALSGVDRGPGLWVLNGGLLEEPGYREQVVGLLEWSKGDVLFMEDVLIWWDNLKYDVQLLSQDYGRWVRGYRGRREALVRKALREEVGRLQEGGEGGDLVRLMELEGELRRIEEEKCKGFMVRSRAQYVVDREKCTKFFFGLEKTRQRAGEIKEVVGGVGNVWVGQKGF